MSDDDPLKSADDRRIEDWAALSSMADGEAGFDIQDRCLKLWADRGDARERWRHYQLIGDVLRSRELAREGAHDAAFLAALRTRLAHEPVMLRPPLRSEARRSRMWATPVAAVAGVAAVVGVVVMLRAQPEADAIAARSGVQPVVVSSPAPPAQAQQPVNGRLIRDARLERYLAAHRQSGAGAALQMPGGGVRSVDTIVLEDR